MKKAILFWKDGYKAPIFQNIMPWYRWKIAELALKQQLFTHSKNIKYVACMQIFFPFYSLPTMYVF